jgi:phosphatidylglycerol---prolipoprotein diacylglyceryl transferase
VTVAYWVYPAIDPVAFHAGPFAVRWYGLAYLVGYLFGWWVLSWLNRRWRLGMSGEDTATIMLAAVGGGILGGRLGYVLLYNLSYYIANPLKILAFADGGMSFHGGLAGAVFAGWIASHFLPVSFLRICDMGSVAVPLGIGLGRVANFINDELWGRVTTVPWGVVFPGAGPLPRHPSQLYEAFLEGAVLLTIMLLLARRKRPDGELLGWMMTLYAACRILAECFRQPDVQIGFLPFGVTMGQLLSLPLLAIGVWLIVRARRSERTAPGEVVA